MSRIALVFLLAFVSMLLAIVAALIGTLFLYAGWNWGIVPATGLHQVDLFQAFWLSLGLSVTGSLLKGTSATAKSD